MYGDRLELTLGHETCKRRILVQVYNVWGRLELRLGHGTLKRQILVHVYNVWGQARFIIGSWDLQTSNTSTSV